MGCVSFYIDLYCTCNALVCCNYRVSAGLLAISVMGYTPARSSSCIIVFWVFIDPLLVDAEVDTPVKSADCLKNDDQSIRISEL